MEYYAKSNPKRTVKEHLKAVAETACEFGKDIGCEKSAYIAGLLHDFGKYSQSFNDVLCGKKSNVDHAVCGATLLYFLTKKNDKYAPVIEAINAHHNGLEEFFYLKNKLDENLKSDKPLENRAGKFSALSGKQQYTEALAAFCSDFDHFKISCEKCDAKDTVQSMLYTRMLFSCLVDADYTVSASDTNVDYRAQTEVNNPDFPLMLKALNEYREKIRSGSVSNKYVNAIRDEVFNTCGNAGDSEACGIYTLTAPTGTGKTLALMNFALHHCIKANKKRIIVVLPFLTLTDQSADIYRNIYSNIIEDHSQSRLTDTQRETASRWSTPIIVTTSVQFFESLFSDLPGDCRKLHNIAESVVIFDEAQSLPIGLTPATLSAIKYLSCRYNTTMVLSTATQPDYTAIQNDWTPTEILPENKRLYSALRRTDVEWRVENNTQIPLDDIANEISTHNNACVIVNLKRHADKLFQNLSAKYTDDRLFYITTELCPAHRRKIISLIKQRQKQQLPCILISTQCIEAGVDLDFDTVYRSLAPLEAIVQAAGRCNRNGTQKQGKVVVFIPDEPAPIYPGSKNNNRYESAAQKVKMILAKHNIDINNPGHLKEYYSLLFAPSLDNTIENKGLTEALKSRSFEKVAAQYRLIEQNTLRLIVPYTNVADCMNYEQIRGEALKNGLTRKLIKEAAAITVSIGYSQKPYLKKYAEQLKFKNGYNEEESGFYILLPQNENFYNNIRGLRFTEDEENFEFV